MASIARLCSRWGSRTRRRRSQRRRQRSASRWSWGTPPARSSLARKRQGRRRGNSISAVRTERTARCPVASRFRTSRTLGAGERNRTADLPLTRRTLCLLSYTGGCLRSRWTRISARVPVRGRSAVTPPRHVRAPARSQRLQMSRLWWNRLWSPGPGAGYLVEGDRGGHAGVQRLRRVGHRDPDQHVARARHDS
jgi:hypothetical protein